MNTVVSAQWAHCPEPATPSADGVPVVLMIATPKTTLRDEARRLVRTTLETFLARLTGCAHTLHTEPGTAPRLDLAVAGRPVHLSISHESGLSLAAIRCGGRVGVDLMHAVDAATPDRETIAHDYLGPDAAAELMRFGVAERQTAFARAWTRHEAGLKCLGMQLQEWSPDLARELAQCRYSELALPAPYIGAVALCD